MKQKEDLNGLSGSCQEDSHSYLFGRRDTVGLENCCEATGFEHTVDVTLQGVGIALSACRER